MNYLNEDGTPKEDKKEFTGVTFTSTTTLSPEKEIEYQLKVQSKLLIRLLSSKWYQIIKRNKLIKDINYSKKRILDMSDIITKMTAEEIKNLTK